MRDRVIPEQEEKKAKREEIEQSNPKIAKFNVKDHNPYKKEKKKEEVSND